MTVHPAKIKRMSLRELPVLGVNREEAAMIVGVGTTKFDEMVADGRMPKPKRIDGRVVWSYPALRAAFDALPEDGERAANPFDEDMD